MSVPHLRPDQGARRPTPVLRPFAMTRADLDEVDAIERVAYPFPWSRGNFEDALDSGYTGLCARDAAGRLQAYSVLMPVVDEVHLLNLCVAPACQGQRLGAALLAASIECARASGFDSMLLEVRPSNTAALGLYRQAGFVQIGRRRNYYPAPDGAREDALVMRLSDLTTSFLERAHEPI
jgi:[ribosomal protein S18]-alanine N-acetyltransferase